MLVKWKKLMKKQTDRKIRMLQFDHVRKYKYRYLWFSQNNSIGIHFTISKHRVTKEMNYPLVEKVQYFLSNASLNKLFWAETLVYATYNGAIGSDTDRILSLPYLYLHPTFGFGYGYRYWRVWKNDICIHQNQISDMDRILADRIRILIGYVKMDWLRIN